MAQTAKESFLELMLNTLKLRRSKDQQEPVRPIQVRKSKKTGMEKQLLCTQSVQITIQGSRVACASVLSCWMEKQEIHTAINLAKAHKCSGGFTTEFGPPPTSSTPVRGSGGVWRDVYHCSVSVW